MIHIQPDEGISLASRPRCPGPRSASATSRWTSTTRDAFGATPETGYETLLYDCMFGDPTLFQRADSVEDGWAVVAPLLDVWRASGPGFPNYAAGSWGPPEADALLARDGRAWHPIAHPAREADASPGR